MAEAVAGDKGRGIERMAGVDGITLCVGLRGDSDDDLMCPGMAVGCTGDGQTGYEFLALAPPPIPVGAGNPGALTVNSQLVRIEHLIFNDETGGSVA